jgi:hypothetical protein
MAIGAFTSSNNFTGFLKPVFKDGVVPRAIPLASRLYDNFSKTKSIAQFKADGSSFEFPVLTGVGGSGGYISEGGTLYDAQAPATIRPTLRTVTIQETMSFTRNMLQMGNRDQSGFAMNTKLIMQAQVENFARKINLSHYGSQHRVLSSGLATTTLSMNGVLGRVSAFAAGVATMSAAGVGAYLGYQNTLLGSTRVCKQYRVGDILAHGTIAGINVFTATGTSRVTAINQSTNQLTLTLLLGIAAAADDFVVWGSATSMTVNSYGKASQGFGMIFNQTDAGGTLQIEGANVDAGNQMGWSTSNIASAGVFLESDLHKAVRQVTAQGAGKPKIMAADPTISDLWYAANAGNVRQVPQTLKGGYKGDVAFSTLQGESLDWLFDQDCPYGVIHFIDPSQWFYAVQGNSKPDFVQTGTGNGGWVQTANADSFYKYMVWDFQICLMTLNSQTAITGINVPDASL